MKGCEAVELIKQCAGSEEIFQIYTRVMDRPGLLLQDLTPLEPPDTIKEEFLRESGRLIRREVKLKEMKTRTIGDVRGEEEILCMRLASDGLFALVGEPYFIHYYVLQQPEEELTLEHERLVKFQAEQFHKLREEGHLQGLLKNLEEEH